MKVSQINGIVSAASLSLLCITFCNGASASPFPEALTKAKDKSLFKKPEPPTKKADAVLRQIDNSGKFKYVLPEGWTVTKTPFHPSDILLRSDKEKPATIYMEVRPTRGNLEKQVEEITAEFEKNLPDFKLISSETIEMSSGQKAAKLICESSVETNNGKDAAAKVNRVVYLLPIKFRKVLMIAAVISEPDLEYGSKVALDLAESVVLTNGSAGKQLR